MEIGVYLVYGILGLFILLGFGALFAPVRLLCKAAIHIGFGFFGLLVCNLFGSLVGVTVGINAVNVLIVSVLGPSGALLLLLLGWCFT